MTIRITRSASQDITEAYYFYEKQSKGLGTKFVDSIFSEIEKLPQIAGIHAKAYGYYRMLVFKFPFAIYYSIETEIVLVTAIIDCRRNPSWIRKRIKHG